MIDLATAKTDFLAKVEDFATGQSARFAPSLDSLISWSETNGLEYTEHAGVADLVKFSIPGTKMAFWAATPRKTDGGKFNLLADPKFPEELRTIAREELAKIDGKAIPADGPPEMAFIKLIWDPYRAQVLDLMARLLAGLRQSGATAQ